ncbi:ankyrin [Dentipellis sp. KUC8613]|nr:ankyrin [Dentipellis sp. KUC8613]
MASILQNKEASSFLARIIELPPGPVSLDDALKPSLEDESALRKLFAQDKTNPRLNDIHVGLVDLFAAPSDVRITRARAVADSEEDLSAKYVIPLPKSRRRAEGAPATVDTLDEFLKNWSIFTEESLAQPFDWNNVVAAGGSVLACLLPLPDVAKVSRRSMRKYFHEVAFPASDVDLFLWGLSPQQAEEKIKVIYDSVRNSVPWDVTCVRTKHTISIHSQYPYRSIQIVLRLYKSPTEILAGFDVDAPCCLYDGTRVWANPRCIVAMMRQCNTVDVMRRSPSYEVRLAKYAARGFEVYVPTLRRADIDPSIYERSISRVRGLARLLVLEKLADVDSRFEYLSARGTLRGKALSWPDREKMSRGIPKKRTGDLKAADTSGVQALEMNDYDVVSLHIPYGPGWTAARIEKLIYKTDLGMNTSYNPRNKHRTLHRHPAYFGALEYCVEDCCEQCPEPRTEEERKLQAEEDKVYIRGRISFVEQDPGRQTLSGSFNPIDDGDWSEQAYVQSVAKLFNAISRGDRDAVKQMIKDGEDIHRRDYVGRTALHYAILASKADIACDLIDAGVRMTARLVGGRTCLHLAAQMGMQEVVRKLLARSAVNQEIVAGVEKRKENKAVDGSTPSGEQAKKDRKQEDDDAEAVTDPDDDPNSSPIDDDDSPDILDVSLPDWDNAFTPLAYAILSGSLETVDTLLAAGANPKLRIKMKYGTITHPLYLTTFLPDEDRAAEIAARLIAAGASCSLGDKNLMTILLRFVMDGKTKLVSTCLRYDPKAKLIVDQLTQSDRWMEPLANPLIYSVMDGNHAMLAILIAYGAKLTIAEVNVSRVEEATNRQPWQRERSLDEKITTPVEIALAHRDYIVQVLINLEADIQLKGNRTEHPILDYVRQAVEYYNPSKFIHDVIEKKPVPEATEDSWSDYNTYLGSLVHHFDNPPPAEPADPADIARVHAYFLEAETLLHTHGAEASPDQQSLTPFPPNRGLPNPNYQYIYSSGWTEDIPMHLKDLYDDLYNACWTGDNARIEQLCIPKQLSESQQPIQVTVRYSHYCRSNAGYNRVGETPLSIAFHRRHWSTMPLILRISAAQYCPNKENECFTVNELVGDGDTDGGSETSEDTVQYPDLVDIAARPSAVRCDGSPLRLLAGAGGMWVSAAGKPQHGALMRRAITQNDFEGFVKLCDLYQFLNVPLWPSNPTLAVIMELDRPEMLDELIRRAGCGIYAPAEPQHDGDGEKDSKPTRREYFGLNILGKKRKDLATKGSPEEVQELPLLFIAANFGATKTIDYLASARPLAAFRYYMSANTDARANYLRSMAGLDKALPKLLGWEINSLNESSLTAAVISSKAPSARFDAIKELFKHHPQLILDAMNARLKFVSVSGLTLAAYCNCSTDIIDFFLEKGCDPTLRDIRGWNIYHLAIQSNDKRRASLISHLLKVLPSELTAALMLQQSYGALNTPLMLATKRARNVTIKTMLESHLDPSVFLVRDAQGSIPLHFAVQSGNETITRLLIEYGPAESLFVENSVGLTPMEIVFEKMLGSIPDHCARSFEEMDYINDSVFSSTELGQVPFELEKQKTRVPKLRAALQMLLETGQLKRGTKVAKELLSFAEKMEEMLKLAESASSTKMKTKESDTKATPEDSDEHGENFTAVADVLTRALSTRTGSRELVHLVDVQQSAHHQLQRQSIGREDPQVVFERKMRRTEGYAQVAEAQGQKQVMDSSGRSRMVFIGEDFDQDRWWGAVESARPQ